MKDVVILFSAEEDTITHTLKSTLFPSVVLLSKQGKEKDVDKSSLHLPAASDVENPVQQGARETKSGCGQTLCKPGMIIAALHWLQFFSSTRSYAALRAADLDWIVGPGYSLGRVHSGEKP